MFMKPKKHNESETSRFFFFSRLHTLPSTDVRDVHAVESMTNEAYIHIYIYKYSKKIYTHIFFLSGSSCYLCRMLVYYQSARIADDGLLRPLEMYNEP